jgi:ribosomal subunit interface protein
MHVIVQSKTLPVTDSLRQFIHRQARKLERLGIRISKASIFLEHVGKKDDMSNAIVKYAVSMPGKKRIVVKRCAADMYQAVVDATDRVIRQLRKAKEKRIERHRRATP